MHGLTEDSARQREGGKNEFRECHGECMKQLARFKEGERQLLYHERMREETDGDGGTGQEARVPPGEQVLTGEERDETHLKCDIKRR